MIKLCRSKGLAYDEIQDILGEAQAELVTSIKSVRKPASIDSFMIQIVRRRIYSKFHSRPRMLRIDLSDLEYILDDESTDDPFHYAMVSELRGILGELIEQLPKRDQGLIYECFFRTPRKPYKEIEEELGVPPNQLGAYRAKALKKLKKRWEDKFGEQ